ncbi:MAG: hypothetical protein V4467_01630 [Patescibacteria group bacterium]
MKRYKKNLWVRIIEKLDDDFLGICPLWVALVLCALVISAVCGFYWVSKPLAPADERFGGVVAILNKDSGAQGRNLYRFATQLTNSMEISLRDASTENIRFFADVPASEPMWYIEKKVRFHLCVGVPYAIEVHIHSPRDLPGVGLELNPRGNRQVLAFE